MPTRRGSPSRLRTATAHRTLRCSGPTVRVTAADLSLGSANLWPFSDPSLGGGQMATLGRRKGTWVQRDRVEGHLKTVPTDRPACGSPAETPWAGDFSALHLWDGAWATYPLGGNFLLMCIRVPGCAVSRRATVEVMKPRDSLGKHRCELQTTGPELTGAPS